MVRLMNSEKPLSGEVTGAPEATLLGRSLGKIPMNVSVALWGMAPLRNMVMKGFQLPSSDDHGVVVKSTDAITNPTGATMLNMGAVDVEVSSSGFKVCSMQVPDLS